MFVRFRQTTSRLQASLIQTSRAPGGKVRHEHVAGLGSVARVATVPERIKFWQHLHQRVACLANRLDAEAQAKVLGAVHTRIPMPTAEEQLSHSAPRRSRQSPC